VTSIVTSPPPGGRGRRSSRRRDRIARVEHQVRQDAHQVGRAQRTQAPASVASSSAIRSGSTRRTICGSVRASGRVAPCIAPGRFRREHPVSDRIVLRAALDAASTSARQMRASSSSSRVSASARLEITASAAPMFAPTSAASSTIRSERCARRDLDLDLLACSPGLALVVERDLDLATPGDQVADREPDHRGGAQHRQRADKEDPPPGGPFVRLEHRDPLQHPVLEQRADDHRREQHAPDRDPPPDRDSSRKASAITRM